MEWEGREKKEEAGNTWQPGLGVRGGVRGLPFFLLKWVLLHICMSRATRVDNRYRQTKAIGLVVHSKRPPTASDVSQGEMSDFVLQAAWYFSVAARLQTLCMPS